ncbi:hypothetical protein cym2001_27370 [Pseudomonas sp. CYM-20-01]|jgi:hypothetical protein|uniref:hypothetical protein n=1 Tax=Pseudomonas sp. CYM-20-01 TaxID=2870750 RepID=UPI002051ABE1|nr:hypothetical protein [Pseudomonas sp. CYM-20-01]BDB19372.1 hypothetical protein cym2001_27370 [Pseudomonas sp. CYM-20-01]
MNQTTGTLTATVVNPQVIPPNQPFIGDPGEMLMYRSGGYIHIAATQRLGPTVNDFNGFNFRIPNIIAGSGSHTFVLGVTARGIYWAHELGGVTPYTAVNGSLTVSLDQKDTLTGTFNFPGENGSQHISVSQGQIDLAGFITQPVPVRLPTVTGTGYMRGDVVGGPLPNQNFDAAVVSLREVDGGGISKNYFEFIGRQYNELGIQNYVAILLDVDQTALTYVLGSNREARALFAVMDSFGFAYAISGSLNFTSLPASGRAAGSLDCMVQKNQEPPFHVNVVFDITA